MARANVKGSRTTVLVALGGVLLIVEGVGSVSGGRQMDDILDELG